MYFMSSELKAEIAAVKAALGPSHPTISALAKATTLTSYKAVLAGLTDDERRAVVALLKGSALVGGRGPLRAERDRASLNTNLLATK